MLPFYLFFGYHGTAPAAALFSPPRRHDMSGNAACFSASAASEWNFRYCQKHFQHHFTGFRYILKCDSGDGSVPAASCTLFFHLLQHHVSERSVLCHLLLSASGFRLYPFCFPASHSIAPRRPSRESEYPLAGNSASAALRRSFWKFAVL